MSEQVAQNKNNNNNKQSSKDNKNNQDRPRTRGNNRNQQSRGAYRGQNNDDRRPQTEGGNRQYRNQGRGGNNRGNNDRNNRGNQRREADPDSWTYKYFHQERTRYERAEVTKDTEIPEVPAKADRVKQPNKEQFDKKMEELENQVKEKRETIRKIIKQKNDIIEGGKIGNTSVTYKQALNDKLAVMKKVIAKKREFQNEVNNLQDDLNVFEQEKNKLRKQMHKDYKSEDEIRDAIKHLESRQETTSLTMHEEKKLINEVEILKKSLPAAKRFEEIKPEVKKLQDRRSEAYTQLKKVRSEVDEIQVEIEALRKELDTAREGQNDQKGRLDDLSSKIDTLNSEITEIYKNKDKTRDEYFHQKYDYECQLDLVRHVEWLTKQKEWVVKQENEAKEMIEEQKQAMANRPNPYYKELEYVEQLVSYCHKLQVDSGLVKESEAVARETQNNLLSDMNKEAVNKKISDGKLQATGSKEEREAQGMMSIGTGGKKRKGKKPKAKDLSEDVFNIDVVIVQKFGFLKVSPPIAPEDLEEKISELNEKKKFYTTEGDRILKEEEEEFKKSLETPVSQPEADEEENKEEAEEVEESKPSGRANNRGGRGGYGRGGRGNNRGNRGGYGAPSRSIRQERQEFEGSDDEEYEKKEQQRPKQKPRNQNKKFNAEDEESFPTF